MKQRRAEKGSWQDYEKDFKALLAARRINGNFLSRTLKDGDCLVCSEPTPGHCHRRPVAEQYKSHDNTVCIVHL